MTDPRVGDTIKIVGSSRTPHLTDHIGKVITVRDCSRLREQSPYLGLVYTIEFDHSIPGVTLHDGHFDALDRCPILSGVKYGAPNSCWNIGPYETFIILDRHIPQTEEVALSELSLGYTEE